MSTAAARSGGGASSTAVNQRAVDFRRQLDEHTRTLLESFGGLLRSAKITNPQSTTREEFQVNVATASLATAGEGLLRQIREVKLAVMLQDEAAMDREVDQALAKIAGERAELEKELEALSNDLKAAYARAATSGRGTAAAAAEAPTSAAGSEGTAAAAAAAAATVDNNVGNSMDVMEGEGGEKQERAAAVAVATATGKEGSSREKVGGEKASKSSKKSSSKKKKDRGSISTEEQGRGGKGGEGDEKNKSKKGRASISADDGPEAEEHAETGGDRGETGGENRAKTRPKKVKDSQTETVKRDKEERGDSTPRSDARPPPKRRRSSKGGEETREEQRDGHNAKPTSKSSSRRRTDEEGTATKNEGDGKEGERKQLNSKSGEHREQDRFEKGKGKSADESNSKPKTKSRAHSPRGSIDLNAQGASTKDDGDKGGKEKDGQERLDRRKDSKSGSSKKTKERRSSKTKDANTGGPESDPVPDAANAAPPVVATGAGGTSSKDKSKRRRSKDKEERRSSKVVDPSSSAGPEPNAVPEAANATVPAVATEEASSKEKPKRRRSKDKKERRSSKVVDPSSSAGPEPNAVPDAANTAAPVVAAKETSTKDKSKGRETKDKKEKDTDGDGSRKKKERRRSSTSRKEKQAHPSKNMEPGESGSLAKEPHDGTPASRSGGEIGDDGSMTTASAAVLIPDSAKLQEGRDNTEVDGKQKSSGVGSSDRTTAAKEVPAVVGAAGSPSSGEPNGATAEPETATSARATDGGPSDPKTTVSSTGGPGGVPSADDVARVAAKRQEENRDAQPSKPPAATARPKQVITSGSGATLPASLLVKEAPPEALLDSTPKAPNAEAPASGDLTDRREEGNSTAEISSTGGPGDVPFADDVARVAAKPQEENRDAQPSKPPPATARPEKVITSGSGATLPASLLVKEAPPEEPLDSTLKAPNAEAPASGDLTERREERDSTNEEIGGVIEQQGAENAKSGGVGGPAAWEGSVSPTPPRARSNPVSRGTPPRRGSRGGNLAICTQQPYPPAGVDGRDGLKPSSPRSRPRELPLVRAKSDASGGGEGAGAGRSGADDEGAEEKVASFSSRRWKASDEYVLDEDSQPNPDEASLNSDHKPDRETPRGGVFAKIPGLDQHLIVEPKKINDPPRCRAPKLISGTVRLYDQEEASEAAFRYPECRGAVFRPSYADDGSFKDLPASSPLLSEPPHRLRLERAHGYHGGGFYPSTDTNAYFLGEDHMPKGGGGSGGSRGGGEQNQGFFEVVYPTAALVVMHKFRAREGVEGGGRNGEGEETAGEARNGGGGGGKTMQRFFDGHTDDVTAVAVHPGGVLVASGQSYGVPSEKPVPGQALHIDDACYCLVSIGVRHSKFWLLTRGLDKGPAKDEIPPVLANAKWTSSQRVQEEREKEVKGRGNLRWIIDGSSARLNGKGSMADFTCVTFIDDSPPLQTWGANNTVVDSLEESDRSSGRVVLGTAAGDLYIFIQRGVRLIPREFAHDVKRGKGGNGIFLDPWWLFGPGHEVTANKRLWDLGAELVDNIPHSKEAANELVLSDKAKERVHALEQKMAVKPLHPAVFEELKRQHDRFSYTGPLTGHEGGVSGLAFNRETGKVVSAGTNGEIVQWQAFFFDPTSSVVSPARTASGAPAAPVPGSTPAPATPLINNSLVGLINERRNRNEEKIQRSLRSRNPSEPTRRRVGNEAPRGDGRVGGVDVFEMDYRTTLGREDEGEISLSGPGPSSRDIDQDQLGPSPSRVDMFGVSGRRDGFESSGSTRGNLERSSSGDPKNRGSSNEHDEEGSLYGGGMGIRFQTGGETGPRVELDVGWSGGRSGDEFGEECGVSRRGGEAAGEGRQSTRQGGGRDHVSPKRSAFLPRGSHGKSLVWSKDGKRLLTGVNTNILLLLEYPGEDRSVAVWNTASNLPVAWCSNIPSPVSCLACSPDLEEVAVGTVNTNEILFLKVHRRTQAGPAPSAKGEGGTNTATHIEPHSSKQLLPASAWAKRRQPGPNFRWITTSPSWDRCQIVTLDGKDTPHMAAGGAASAGSGSAGGAAAPFKPNSATKMSPVRERARSASLGGMGHAAGASSGGDPSTPPRKSPSRPPTMGAGPGTGNGGGAGCRSGEHSGRRGRRRYSDGGEPQRGMGATCMRYSPSGSHLAIGCKNGSLVIMAVESSPDTDRGGRTSGDDNDGSRHTGPGDSGRPLEGRGTDGGRERSAELSGGIEGQDGEPWSPSSRRRPRERRKVYRRIAHLKGHSSRVLHLDWTVDGRFVHTCGQDYHILHWEVLPPPPHRRDEGAAEEAALNDDGNGGGDDDGEAVAGEFRPRMFKRAFLVRDEQWATWSSTIGWPVQGVFPAYSDNTDVNSVDVCPDRELLAAADDARTIRLLRYPVLRGGARNRSYTAHSSHVMGARFTVGVKPTRLITVGGVDSTVIQWVVEGAPVDDGG
eukprot:g16706.t1